MSGLIDHETSTMLRQFRARAQEDAAAVVRQEACGELGLICADMWISCDLQKMSAADALAEVCKRFKERMR